MLRSLLAYSRGAGVDARWVVIGGTPEFFRITKRIHNNLHGAPGDGGDLGPEEARTYETGLKDAANEIVDLIRPEDIVIVHDPQPAGLVGAIKNTGALVIWRCHVGLDFPNELARRAWRFLTPHIDPADAYIFSREAYAWEGLEGMKITVIPPSIDAFSPKNQELEAEAVVAILQTSGVTDGRPVDGMATFVREDGSPGRVDRRAEVFEESPAPHDARLIVQVSRWDRLKDPVGVIEGFGHHVKDGDAHLIVAGPAVEAVSDDPEGAEVLEESKKAWEKLPDDVRDRVHLACLPMEDGEENAAIVNALQRRAHVVVQKSIAEGFGLTVAEAMWKARPVVASRIGGIQDQVVEGATGHLVDPHDLADYGRAVSDLLADDDRAHRMGAEAQQRVRNEFLGPRHLMQYVALIDGLLREPRD
jgi:trehalose synthase